MSKLISGPRILEPSGVEWDDRDRDRGVGPWYCGRVMEIGRMGELDLGTVEGNSDSVYHPNDEIPTGGCGNGGIDTATMIPDDTGVVRMEGRWSVVELDG